MFSIITQSDLDCLVKQINTAKIYIKNVFRHEISIHSPVRSHCINWNCSDPENAAYSSLQNCPLEDMYSLDEGHNDKCLHCEAIPKIFKMLSGILEAMKDYIKPTELGKARYALKCSEFHIDFFKGFTMRSKINTWRDVKNNLTESECCLTMDFPQKYFETQYRGTTTDYFARSGHIWLIMAFAKKVMVDGKQHFQTFNYVCILDQRGGYGPKKQDVSIVVPMLQAAIAHFKGAHDEITSVYVKVI